MKILIAFLTLLLSFQSQAKLADGLYAKIRTNQGEILIQLEFEKAPLTVINFVGLAEGVKNSNIKIGTPFYNGLKFHRVIDNFMIQGGDPKGNGTGGPGYKFADEFTDLKHDRAGTLSMANSGPATNGSQFFITHTPTPHLDGKHTVFGYVVKGMGVVNRIKKDDFIRKVKIIRIGEKAEKFKVDEAAFQAQQQKINAEKSAQQAVKNTKSEVALAKFVSTKYPNAKQGENGYYIKVDQVGSAQKPKKGDAVTITLAIELSDGTSLKKDGEPLVFTVGANKVIPILEQSISSMSVGEKRTIIANYTQVYGDRPLGGLPTDSLLIFNLELISIGDKK
ncbi:Peptidyl-prolyl cis-trans isomerase [uncultured Candidatus Thioglobus sp.]|nr:Peptidyl-prolyl cis-trans isomerase [uncultured Candidatus Thioglobus sp.]